VGETLQDLGMQKDISDKNPKHCKRKKKWTNEI
jgi:hypothetical protein